MLLSALPPYLCLFLLVSIVSLRRELRQANRVIHSHESAYRRGYAKISDHEFDQMVVVREKLKSRLRAVAAHAPELEDLGHSISLLSLDNQRFEYWYSTLPVATPMIVQPKIDGCSLGLRYVDGRLVHAAKRCGSDVLDVALAVPTIPRRIQVAGVVEIHGELHTLDAADPQKSQKTAARALNCHVSNDGLVFTAYRTLGAAGNEACSLEFLRKIGFSTPDSLVCTYPQQVKQLHQHWLDGQLFSSYPTDGIVVKVYEHDLQREMGLSNGAKPCPLWALAMKRYD